MVCFQELELATVSPSKFEYIKRLSKSKRSVVYLVKKRNGADKNNLYIMKSYNAKKNRPSEVMNELQIQKKLNNENCVAKLRYSFKTKNEYFSVVDFKPRGSLRDNFSVIVENESAVKLILAEILLGIERLHRSGIVHRDLKLENIVLDEDGHVYFIDFEMSSMKMTGMTSWQGTPGYIAPEVDKAWETKGETTYDYRIDYWSYGIIAFQLL